MRGLRRIIFAAAAATVALAIPAAGQAGGAPAIAWTPTTSAGTFNYGTIDAGTTPTQTFTLTNSGGSATSQLGVSLSGSSAFTITSDKCSTKSIGTKKTCTVTVQYAPTGNGTDSATLRATSAKPAATATITLTGKSVNVTLACPGPIFLGPAALPDIVNGKLGCLLTVPGASITTSGQLQATSPLGTDTLTYDQAGHLLRIGDASGAQTSFSGSGSLLTAGATTFAYDAAGHVLSSMSSAGTTAFTYNTAGNLASVTDPTGMVTTFTYNAAGNLASVIDPAGVVRTFTYDASGDLLTAGAYSFVNNSAGQVVSSTDPGGTTTTYTYNDAGQLASSGVTSFTYGTIGGNSGLLLAISGDPVAGTTSFTYDGMGRLTSGTSSPPPGPASFTTRFSYDDVNHTETVTNPSAHVAHFSFNTAGDVITAVNYLGTPTTFTYR